MNLSYKCAPRYGSGENIQVVGKRFECKLCSHWLEMVMSGGVLTGQGICNRKLHNIVCITNGDQLCNEIACHKL